MTPEKDLRPEELILEVYRQREVLTQKGISFKGVVLSKHHYDAIQIYHAQLGDMQNQAFEYIKKDSLFGLEIYIDNSFSAPKVI